jgi:N-dimethylarginine dimethylaminohydrolase
LHERVPAEMRIEATEEDLRHFSVNAVCLGRRIVMAKPPTRLRGELTDRGYSVAEVDLAPFMLSGGGAFCMTLRLDLQGPVRIPPATEATPAPGR